MEAEETQIDGELELPAWLEFDAPQTAPPQQEKPDIPSDLAEYASWALEKAGTNGPFQCRLYFATGAINFAIAMQMMLQVFLTMPPLRADTLKPFTGEDCFDSAVRREFAKPFSVSSEFGLVCENAMGAPLLGTLFFIGMGFGVTCFGVLADHRGRWLGCMLAGIFNQFGGLLAVVSPNYHVYAIARLFVGLGYGGLATCNFIWFSEMVGDKGRRILMMTGAGFGFSLGCIIMSPIAYLVPQWRAMSAVPLVLAFPILCAVASIPESPAWYVTQGKSEHVHRAISRIAAINGRPQPPPCSASPTSNKSNGNTGKTRGALRQLLCDARLSHRFLPLCFAWFASAFGYFGIVMNAGHVGVSVYVANIISVLTELPASPFALWVIGTAWGGRRGLIVGGLLFGGTCCLLCAPAANPSVPPVVLLALVYIGKFAMTASFNSLYVWVAELFPTSVRSQSLGFQSLFARIGGMIAPVIADLGRTSPALPLVIFGAPAILAGLLLVRLPETRGQPMPDTIDDLPANGALCPCLRRYDHLEEDTETARQPRIAANPAATVVGNGS